MKSRLSWILLVIYLNAAAQMLLPFVQDCFAHLFFWEEHLAHVHHGHDHSHHVASEMAVIAGQNDVQSPNGHLAFQFVKDNLSLHLPPPLSFCIRFVASTFLTTSVPSRPFFCREVYTEVVVPPPDRA